MELRAKPGIFMLTLALTLFYAPHAAKSLLNN